MKAKKLKKQIEKKLKKKLRKTLEKLVVKQLIELNKYNKNSNMLFPPDLNSWREPRGFPRKHFSYGSLEDEFIEE